MQRHIDLDLQMALYINLLNYILGENMVSKSAYEMEEFQRA